jgi:hypothetical protein
LRKSDVSVWTLHHDAMVIDVDLTNGTLTLRFTWYNGTVGMFRGVHLVGHQHLQKLSVGAVAKVQA